MTTLNHKPNLKRLVKVLLPVAINVLAFLNQSVTLDKNLSLIHSGGQNRDQHEQVDQRNPQQEQIDRQAQVKQNQ